MFFIFLAALLFFHLSEYFLACTFTPDEVSNRSFLVSKHYVAAMSCGCLEYGVELWLFPFLKDMWLVSFIGLAFVVLGETIRKVAYITAQHNFTHDIKDKKRASHKMVTHGIYSCVRHPGYMGWFVWSISTQILLCNPVCTILFTIVAWRFFAARIPYEEYYLRQFFGNKYPEYCAQVPSGIPFVS